jgi:hypothetical protein
MEQPSKSGWSVSLLHTMLGQQQQRTNTNTNACKLAMWGMHASAQIYLRDIIARASQNYGQTMTNNGFCDPIVRCVLDGYRNMRSRQHPSPDSIKIPFTTVLVKKAFRQIQIQSSHMATIW